MTESLKILRKVADRFELLSEEQWKRAAVLFTEKKLKAREVLVMEGTVYLNWYFIVSGVMRFHRSINEKDTTFNLFYENRFVIDSVSLFEKIPSEYNLSAITDSTVLVVSNERWEELYKSDAVFERQGRIQFEHFMKVFMFKIHSTLFDSPEKQYCLMQQTHPDLIEKIPQRYIASYLGITPQSLSRIKRRIRGGCYE